MGFFCHAQPVQLTLRAHYICRLATKLTDELYFLLAVLLFLLVEDRADTAVRTRRVTAQPGDVLLLVFLIADSNGAVADGRMTASVRMPAVAPHGYHPARHIAAEAVTDSTTAADADAAVRHRIIRLVMDVAPAQRPGIKAVFVRRRRTGNHPAVQLRVISHRDIEPAAAREYPALLLHRVVVALHFVLAGADVAGAGHSPEREAAPCRHAGLLRLVIVAVLLAGYPQVAPHVCRHGVAARLRAVYYRVASADERQCAAAVQRRLRPGRTVALLVTAGGIHVREYADARARYRPAAIPAS
nr:hypothetical protein [Atlantibacter hermannii]